MADVRQRTWMPPPTKWRVNDQVGLRLKEGRVAGPFTVTACVPPKIPADTWRYEVMDKHGKKKKNIADRLLIDAEFLIPPSTEPAVANEEPGVPKPDLSVPDAINTSNPDYHIDRSRDGIDFGGPEAYSETKSLRDPTALEYVKAFGEELSRSLPPDFDKSDFEKVSDLMNDILQTYALKMSIDSNTAEQRSLTYLVHRYRSQITEDLRGRYDAFAEEDSHRPTADDEMSVEEKMSLLWGNINQHKVFEDNDPDNIPEDDENETLAQLPPLEKCRDITRASLAYKWLVWKICVTERLACFGTHNAPEKIRSDILGGLMVRKQFHRGKLPHATARYLVFWNPFNFHAEQQYTCSVAEVLVQAITITGDGNNLQAATCLEYIDQTWGSSGVRLLRILQETINQHTHNEHTFTGKQPMADSSVDTNVSAVYSDGRFEVTASGIPYSVAEVGEILTWLVSALQSSPLNQAVSLRPSLTFKVGLLLNNILEVEISSSTFENPQQFSVLNLDQSGSCWMACFRNPVVVKEYPILRRSRAESGLEISLDIMLSITNSKFMVDFCKRTFFKGFSMMLAVMEVVDSTIFWHSFYNEGGKYISYEDARVPRLQEHDPAQTVNHDTLVKSRHILGWCKEVSCMAGTRTARYDINWSGLLKPHSSCAFDKLSISAGKYLTVGASLSIGIKDKSEHVSFEDDYLSTLLMISERYFVIYDVEERRAWLLDGISTLLHLLKAFIRYSQDDSLLEGFFILKEDDIEEGSSNKDRRKAAFDILANEKNQRLPLWRKTSAPVEELTMKAGDKAEEALKLLNTYFCLKDRVLQICRLLQQTTAHHDDVHSRDGVGARIKRTPRRQIEGFDFMDIATHQGTLWPKVDEIHSWGEGWVDFTRELHCATLFGTGFGELMEPVGKSCELCMSNVPQGPDLLAVTSADLQRIIKRNGDKKAKQRVPRRVIEDIHWYVPEKLFEDCTCDQYGAKARSDRVQVFIPTSHPKAWGKGSQTAYLPEGGAILVGHSFKFPLRWGRNREPEKGQSEPLVKYNTTLDRDSGID